MIIADTSVFISHLKKTNSSFQELLERGEILTHSFVIGEIMCGSLNKRNEVYHYLTLLPKAQEASFKEIIVLLETNKLYSRGVGWIDLSILASALIANVKIWTLDKKLAKIADRFEISFN